MPVKWKSKLGLGISVLAAAAFALAYYVSVRPGASWIDGQWLFLVALPYNWTVLSLFGVSDFSPDAPAQLAYALIYNLLLAYLAGALIEVLIRGAIRMFRRTRPST